MCIKLKEVGGRVSNVIHIKFKPYSEKRPMSADVYSYDIKKYQFEIMAGSASEAYHNIISEAAEHGIDMILCVAIYDGFPYQRLVHQLPEKVWYQFNSAVNN